MMLYRMEVTKAWYATSRPGRGHWSDPSDLGGGASCTSSMESVT